MRDVDERQSDLPPIYPAVRLVLGSEASRTFPLKDDAQNVIAHVAAGQTFQVESERMLHSSAAERKIKVTDPATGQVGQPPAVKPLIYAPPCIFSW